MKKEIPVKFLVKNWPKAVSNLIGKALKNAHDKVPIEDHIFGAKFTTEDDIEIELKGYIKFTYPKFIADLEHNPDVI